MLYVHSEGFIIIIIYQLARGKKQKEKKFGNSFFFLACLCHVAFWTWAVWAVLVLCMWCDKTELTTMYVPSLLFSLPIQIVVQLCPKVVGPIFFSSLDRC